MNAAAPGPVTRLLIQWGQGKEEALQELMQGQWRDIRDKASYSPERFTKDVYQHVMAGLAAS